jgi:hypothetical protein
VYFGRTEYAQIPATLSGGAVDPNPVDYNPTQIRSVAAVYCVDGFNGGVVWRYQTYDNVDNNGNATNNSIESSPLVTRLNVITDPTGTNPATTNKLVVIVGDDHGWLYCLDAIGNGDGGVIDGDNTTANYGYPINSTTGALQIGTTRAYWIYRPVSNPPAPTSVDDSDYTGSQPLVTYTNATVPDHNWDHGVPPASTATAYLGSYSRIIAEQAETTPAAAVYSFTATTKGVYTLFAHIPGLLDPANPIFAQESRLPDVRYTVTINDGANVSTNTYSVDQTVPSSNVNILGANQTFTLVNASQDTPSTISVSISNVSPSAIFATPRYYVVTDSISLTLNASAYTMPVTQAFNTASAAIYTDPSSWDPIALCPSQWLYIGNSNGVLYKFDARGTPYGSDPYLQTYNEFYPVSDLDSGVEIPTIMPQWWFSSRGNNISGQTGDIEGSPAIYVPDQTNPSSHIVLFGTSHEGNSGAQTQSMGHLYALKDTGPVGSDGLTILTPGQPNYLQNERPYWSFPHAYNDGGVNNSPISPALGDISGSPVVYVNTDPVAQAASAMPRVYFAANTGYEVPFGTSPHPTPTPTRALPGISGRIWCLGLDTAYASDPFRWSFPAANDPNNASLTTTAELEPPIGGFSHATPAIGVVHFPAVINDSAGSWSRADMINSDVKNKSIPMLYAGCENWTDSNGANGPTTGATLFALDLDGGDSTATGLNAQIDANSGAANGDRKIYSVLSPDTYPYTSSPVLVVNSAVTNPASPPSYGNGGSVFITANNTLYQFSATPVTQTAANTKGPLVGLQSRITGFGPLSAPAFAACNTTDLAGGPGSNITLNATTGVKTDTNGNAVETVTDWLYCGDSFSGFVHGVTTDTQLYGVGTNVSNDYIPPAGPSQPQLVQPQFPIDVYLMKPAGVSGSNLASQSLGFPGSPYAYKMDGTENTYFYDWGQPVTLRFTNVLPPNPNNSNPNLRFPVPDKANYYFTNTARFPSGMAVQYTLTSQSGSSTTTGIGTLYSSATTVGPDGFYPRVAGGTDGYIGIDDGTQPAAGILKDANGTQYQYVITHYLLSDAPDPLKSVTARQTVAEYQTAGNTDGSDKYIATVTIATSAVQTELQPVPPPTPTFGVANPFGVIGSYESSANSLGELGVPGQPNPLMPVSGDEPTLERASNGNKILQSIPKAGVDTGNTDATASTDPSGTGSSSLQPVNCPIGTGTGFVHTGRIGDNSYIANTGQIQYGLNIEDRSLIGQRGQKVPVSVSYSTSVGWVDNSGYNGPGARINPLPWEDLPVNAGAATNTSVDYPDIQNSNMGLQLYTNSANSPLLAGSGGPIVNINVNNPQVNNLPNLDSISADGATHTLDQVSSSIMIPTHQPANLTQASLYGTTVPSGYVATVDVFSPHTRTFPQNQKPKFDPTLDAYREINVYVGVPVDAVTRIAQTSVNVGSVQSGFGTFMTGYLSGLGNQYPNVFSPYTQYYYNNYNAAQPIQYFKPLNIYNQGNVNLLNVHLDQKLLYENSNKPSQLNSLNIQSNSVDPLAFIPGYDWNNTTGISDMQAFKNLPNSSIPEQPFLIRSSLDTDLYQAYGKNPYILSQNDSSGNALRNTYWGATFHKARPGQPDSLLTVPDISVDNIAGSLSYEPSGIWPTINANTNTQANYALPYIGVAVPYGTPAGTYSQLIRLFDGTSDSSGNQLPLNPLSNQLYSGISGGTQNCANYSGILSNREDDIFVMPPGASPGSYISAGSTQAFSDPGTTIQVNVTENHLTNEPVYNPGTNLPQGVLTQVPASTNGVVPTFNPVAIRNTYFNANGGNTNSSPGSISMLWTSPSTSSTRDYNLSAAFLNTDANGNFVPNSTDPTNPSATWWTPVNLSAEASNPIPAGYNYAPAIAQDQELYDPANDVFMTDGSAYAFFVNSYANPSASNPNQTLQSLYCDTIDPSSCGLAFYQTVVSQSQFPMYNVSGLKFAPQGIYSMVDPITHGAIGNNLWVFWNSASNGASSIYFSSMNTAAPAGGFSPPAQLPIPSIVKTLNYNASANLDSTTSKTGSGILTSVSSATATLVYGPDTNDGNNSEPLIQVTYSGTNDAGNADVYVTRYRPYIDPSTGNVSLRPVPNMPVYEQLVPDSKQNALWWSARDVGWSRSATPVITVYDSATNTIMGQTNTTGSSFDLPSQMLILPNQTFAGLTGPTNVYVDMGRGRVRFDPAIQSLKGTNPDTIQIFADVAPLARRITTDPRADINPVAFIDAAFKPNEGLNKGVGSDVSSRVQAARSWTIWRKSAAAGKSSQNPAIYFNTQRLTVFLRDANGAAVGIAGDPVSVTDTNTGVTLAPRYYDVDCARGRIYFPLLVPGTAGGYVSPEGHLMSISFSYIDSNNNTQNVTIKDYAMWMDESRANTPQDNNSAPAMIQVSGQPNPAFLSAIPGTASNESMFPNSNPINEDMPYAFLDPLAYADLQSGAMVPYKQGASSTSNPDQTHKVYLFWTSSRNASANSAADIYFETIAPRFSAQ